MRTPPEHLFNDALEWVKLLATETGARTLHLYKEKPTPPREEGPTTTCEVELVDCARLSAAAWRRFVNEATCYASVGSHPHVVRFLDVGYHQAGFVCIKRERKSRSDLRRLVDSLKQHQGASQEVDARNQFVFAQLVHAVDYCHRLGICNLDIRPSTIDVVRSKAHNNNRVVLKLRAQFHSSKVIPGDAASECAHALTTTASPLGDGAFLAPEILAQLLRQQPGNVTFDGRSVDVWSLGCVLFFVLFGREPFFSANGGGSRADVLHRVERAQWEVPPGQQQAASEEALEVLRQTLAPKETRCTMQQLQQLPWVQRGTPKDAPELNATLRDTRVVDKLNRVISVVEAAFPHLGVCSDDGMCPAV